MKHIQKLYTGYVLSQSGKTKYAAVFDKYSYGYKVIECKERPDKIGNVYKRYHGANIGKRIDK